MGIPIEQHIIAQGEVYGIGTGKNGQNGSASWEEVCFHVFFQCDTRLLWSLPFRYVLIIVTAIVIQ